MKKQQKVQTFSTLDVVHMCSTTFDGLGHAFLFVNFLCTCVATSVQSSPL